MVQLIVLLVVNSERFHTAILVVKYHLGEIFQLPIYLSTCNRCL